MNEPQPAPTPAPSDLSTYRHCFQHARHGILLLDGATGEVTDANLFALSLLGCPAAGIVGRKIWEIPLFRDLAGAPTLLQRLAGPGCLRFADLLWKSGGEALFLEIVCHSYIVGTKKTIQCDLHDITDRKWRELQLRHTQTMSALARMAARMADELNCLLPVVSASSDLVLNPSGRAQPLPKTLGEIQRARSRIATLARDLLAFSGRQALQTQLLNLNEVVSDMDGALRAIVGERIQLLKVFDPDLPPVRIDPAQIRQVLCTLAAHAREALPEDAVLTIETARLAGGNMPRPVPSGSGPYVVLSVRDNGRVPDDETWSRLFEPSFGKDQGENRGLGLATVYGAVKQNGGWLSVSSEPGQGNRFRIYLPACEGAAGHPDTVPAESRPSETILLVEPEEGLRNLMRNVLTRKGYRILEAPREEEALRLSREYGDAIDLLVAALVPPGFAAVSLAKTLNEARPRLKVLYISDFAEEGASRPLPADAALLEKPFQLDALLSTVRAALERK